MHYLFNDKFDNWIVWGSSIVNYFKTRCKLRHDEFFKRQFEDDQQEKRAEHEYVITKQVIGKKKTD